MGKRGPKPLPTKLKVLQGTARREDIEREEPKPKPVRPRCPQWLPTRGKRKWRQLAPELEELGLLTSVDGEALAIALLHWSLAVEAAEILKKEGTIATDERGLPRKHPACQILRDNSASFRHYMQEFGLSPSSRTQFNLPTKEEDDWLEEFLK
jgi:P27 family predicted phage terminase small subunit